MSFDTEESGRESGKPIWLYEFRIGSAVTYLSGSPSDEVVSGNTYRAAAIVASQPRVSRAKPGSDLEIRLPIAEDASAPVSRAWLASLPEGLSTVKIRKFHRDDPALEAIYFWTGYVVSSSYDNLVGTLLCRALPAYFTKSGPRMNWGTSCNHVLFDARCGLNVADYTIAATISGIASDGVTYTLSGIGALADGTLTGGKIAQQGGFAQRLLVSHVGNVVKLQYVCPDLVLGLPVSVVWGCGHDLQTCNDKFDNVANYGGHPYVPRVNPFERGLRGAVLDRDMPIRPFIF